MGESEIHRYSVLILKNISTFNSHFAENESWALENFRIEQQYVSNTLRDDLEFWPEKWVRSFKRSCRPTFPFNLIREPQEPVDMRILVFHGYPLPDQAIEGYKGGLLKSNFACPMDQELLAGNR